MIKKNMKVLALWILVFFTLPLLLNAQRTFQHPGILHKKSDLDRMKLGIEAGVEPWASSFKELQVDSYSSYNYKVRGDASWTYLNRENPQVHSSEFGSDVCAAYQNALMWYFTDDQRHANKAIEILNAWCNIKWVDGIPLGAGLFGFPLVQAAELIRHTNAGWSTTDIQKFSAMLVYPGYSNTQAPTTDSLSFYWKAYLGDDGRMGNQDLSGYMTVMAIGVFLDNEIIYDRGLRYVLGQKHREDDLPYTSGPHEPTTIKSENPYYVDYNYSKQSSIEDYGYDGVIEHYIYDNGQCQESSRDQSHPFLGMHIINRMAETAWIQGDDIYGHLDNRLLLGLEFSLKYNVSFEKSYPDQLIPWEPTNYYQRISRVGRTKALTINPWTGSDLTRNSRGGMNSATYYEMALGHYKYRTNLPKEDYLWLQRARDLNIEKTGKYEVRNKNLYDSPGWGALCYSRPMGCAGEPLKNIVNNIPEFELPVVPTTIEAENFDYYNLSAGGGEGLTYHDLTPSNTGGQYRTNDGVDIETCSEGGYNLTGLENGEWLTYTVAVPNTGLYDITINYASANENGKIKFSFGGTDKTEEIVVPFGETNSNGLTDWKDYTLASDIILSKGVQSMKISFSGDSNAFVLNKISITEGNDNGCENGLSNVNVPSFITEGINYSYYEGTWDALPDFTVLTAVETGLHNTIELIDGWASDNFAAVYTGYIAIPIDGAFTFYTSSDEGSRLYIDGNLIVDNDGLHIETAVSGEVCLNEGYHEIKVEYFEKTGDETLTVQYEGPGISKRNLEGLLALGDCENASVELPSDAVAGIGYHYYEGAWTALPDFDELEVLGMGTTSSINLNMAKVSDYYGIVFSGYFNVAKDGDYTFYTTSDDGSALYIDGIKIVNNDGNHGNVTKSGNMCLAAGWHQIEVHYYENSGGQSLYVMWEGEGFTRRHITGYYTTPISAPIKKNQSITFNSLDRYLGEDDFAAATTSSGLPITYASYNTEVATVVDGKVHLVAEGEARIRATQSGNLFYNAANVQFGNIIVSPKESQTITVSNMTKYVGDEDFDPAVASSGLPITYTSYNTNVATIANGKIHIEGPGSAFVRVVQAGNYKYLPATSKLFTLTVEQQTAIEDVLARSIKVYPNPAEDLLYIQSENLIGAELNVISLLGENINSNRIESETTTVNLQNLNKGVYIIKITIGGKALNYKVIKE